MRHFGMTFRLLFFAVVFVAFPLGVFCEESQLHFLYFKNGVSMRCDSVWKGMGDYAWCSNSQGSQAYPDDEVDVARTFRIQAAVNQLIDKSLYDFGNRNWDQVISDTSSAIALEPTNEVAYTNRAGAYDHKGMFEEAIKDCNEATRINPFFGLAYNNRGYAFERTGRFEEALSEYDMSCRLGNNLGCSNYERLKPVFKLIRH